jgi:hypothetical protein
MHSMWRHALVLLLGLVAAGCSGSTSTTSVSSTNVEHTELPTTSSASPEPRIVLWLDGVGPVRFGAPPPTAVDALTTLLGRPTSVVDRPGTSGCDPGSRTVAFDGLAIEFTDAKAGDTDEPVLATVGVDSPGPDREPCSRS